MSSGGWWRAPWRNSWGHRLMQQHHRFRTRCPHAQRSECVAHVLQGLCELDDHYTVTSIDGISAYDLVSRAALLDGLLNRVGGGSIAVRAHVPRIHLVVHVGRRRWSGAHHPTRRRRGARRRPHAAPLLFGSAFKHLRSTCVKESSCSPFWTMSFIVTRSGASAERCMRLFMNMCSLFARTRNHGGKTQLWNRAGVRTTSL